jgi:DNA-binding response OmpR family regulator
VDSTRNRQTVSILFIDPDGAQQYLDDLRRWFTVAVAGTANEGAQLLAELRPALVIAELGLDDRDGVAICRAAKALHQSAAVLAIISIPEMAPDALNAGCDGILLKPFATNVLYALVGQWLRPHDAPVPLPQSWPDVARGTTVVWPSVRCPHCRKGNCVSFDAISERRLWYACLHCRRVWVGPRIDQR